MKFRLSLSPWVGESHNIVDNQLWWEALFASSCAFSCFILCESFCPKNGYWGRKVGVGCDC